MYPISDIETPNKLAEELGLFWTYYFGDSAYVNSLCNAVSDISKQTLLNYIETQRSLSSDTVPIYHQQKWYPVKLLQSTENNNDATRIKYGDGGVYGPQADGHRYVYGGNAVQSYKVYDIDANLKNVSIICDKVMSPSIIWVRGIDFIVNDDGSISFRTSPFSVSSIERRYMDSDNDYECTLWLYDSSWEREYIKKSFGSYINVNLPSSLTYKNVVNTVWKAKIQGPETKYIKDILSAVSGVQFAKTDGEVVQVINTDFDELMIITDQNVYKFDSDAISLVSVGDTLTAYQELVDVARVYEMSSAEFKETMPTDVPAIVIGSNMLNGNLTNELTFKNERVDLVYDGLVDGKVSVTFEVGGFPTDVTLFWDMVHSNGIAQGATLANYLDKRTDPVGEPQPQNLPATINPMQFIMTNLLCNNVILIKLRPLQFSTDSVNTITYLRFLRNVMPPHTTILVYLEVDQDGETVYTSELGTTTEAGIDDSGITQFLGTQVTDTAYEADSAPVGDYLTYREQIVAIKSYIGNCAK